jgi:hypothetical protein
MADVDGTVINGTTFDPLRENATGDVQAAETFDPLLEEAVAEEISNSTAGGGGGGGATVVRQNPELTRTSP